MKMFNWYQSTYLHIITTRVVTLIRIIYFTCRNQYKNNLLYLTHHQDNWLSWLPVRPRIILSPDTISPTFYSTSQLTLPVDPPLTSCLLPHHCKWTIAISSRNLLPVRSRTSLGKIPEFLYPQQPRFVQPAAKACVHKMHSQVIHNITPKTIFFLPFVFFLCWSSS